MKGSDVFLWVSSYAATSASSRISPHFNCMIMTMWHCAQNYKGYYTVSSWQRYEAGGDRLEHCFDFHRLSIVLLGLIQDTFIDQILILLKTS